MKTCCLHVLLLVTMAVAAAAWEDVNDPHIQELSRWAVEQTKSVLRFNKVLAARHRIVDGGGLVYELTIAASPRLGDDERYRAVVYEQGRSGTRRLLSFDAAQPSK
ncbi:hypothetical protein ACP70R_020579 [Stipagrostis hirtigluma subsp. patula]